MANTKRVKLASLMAQKSDLSTELNALKKARAEARVNDQDFTEGARINALIVELEQIDEAILLAQSYADDEEEREVAGVDLEVTKSNIQRIAALKETYLEQIKVVQRASGELASAMSIINEKMRQMDALASDLYRNELGQAGSNFPELQSTNYVPRIAARMADQLSDKLHMFASYRVAEVDTRAWSEFWDVNEGRLLDNVFAMMLRQLNSKVERLQAVVGV